MLESYQYIPVAYVTVHCIKVIGKLNPCTGTEALYRPYGLQGEQRYSSTLPWPRHQKGVRSQRHAPAALYPRERPGTHCTGGLVGPRAGLDRFGKSRRHRDSIHGPSSPQPVAIPTTLLGPKVFLVICGNFLALWNNFAVHWVAAHAMRTTVITFIKVV